VRGTFSNKYYIVTKTVSGICRSDEQEACHGVIAWCALSGTMSNVIDAVA
jgi:hypothetical protein